MNDLPLEEHKTLQIHRLSMRVAGPVLLGALVLTGACSSGDDPEALTGDAGTPDVIQTSGPLMPWAVGDSWTFKVTDNGVVSTKVTTVGDLEMVGGTGPNAAVMANKVLTTKDVNDKTISWQGDTGTRVVRYREQSFKKGTDTLTLEEHWDPSKLHVDTTPDHLKANASWLEIYQETKLVPTMADTTATSHDRWTVTSEGEVVTVPAGTFKAVVLTKAGGSTAKTYWFVYGVGKVKETGGQTEELVSYILK